MKFQRHMLLSFALTTLMLGCGTTQERSGTEQLLLSDSVDRAIDQMDFGVLSGRTVYLDTSYLRPVKGFAFVNAEYIISALRQKLTTSGCLIQPEREKADYVIEARVGALGTDSLQITYGLPANNPLSKAADLMVRAPVMPTIPEISVGKRNETMSTSKVVAYAYHRESGTPVWQSGATVAKSDARDTWILGAGPLQRGSIYDGPRFAGAQIRTPGIFRKKKQKQAPSHITIAQPHQFVHPAELEQKLADARAAREKADQDEGVVPAGHKEEQPATK